jgi:putative aminopeptidase FrvX
MNTDRGPSDGSKIAKSENRSLEKAFFSPSEELYREVMASLQVLVQARGPSGGEKEVSDICEKRLSQYCDTVSVDLARNVIGYKKGREKGLPVKVMAHMDELAMMVKRIEGDGSLIVRELGGMIPANFGQGSVDILGDKEIIKGVLSYGPMHISDETSKTWELIPAPWGKDKVATCKRIKIETLRSPAELKEAGVHAGTHVVIGQERRQLVDINYGIAGFFMDNRAPLSSMLTTVDMLAAEDIVPLHDTYFIATTKEEIGAAGAVYASKVLPEGLTIALDIVPVAEEYDICFSDGLVIAYKDPLSLYDKRTSDALLRVANGMGLQIHPALLESYGSDSSRSVQYGQTPRAVLLAIPTINTHGFEIIHKNVMFNLAEFLKRIVSIDVNFPESILRDLPFS